MSEEMIVLFNPRSSAQRKPVLPMSLLALAAVLEGEVPFTIVDGNLVADPLATLDALLRGGARCLAVTVMPGPQLEQALPVCRELRRRHPGLQVIWGGYFPTQHWEACLRSDAVDLVVRGHAERVFRELLRHPPGAIPALPGLAWRDPETGEPLSNPLPPVPDPDALPDYPYHALEMPRYVRQTFMGRTLSHHSSYGCPFFCNFCAVVNLVQGRWRAQSAERVERVVRRLAEHWGAEAVEFHDNNFFVDEARVAEFAERIEDLGLSWWGEGRIDTMLRFDEATWRGMAASGLRMVFVGAESGSDATLRRMDKGGSASVEATLAFAEKARRHRIVPELSFVLGSPPDPEADVAQTLGLVRRVKRINPLAEIIFYLYTPVPLAGELYESSRRAGFRFPETLDEWVSPAWNDFALRRSRRLPWLESPLRRRIRNFEAVLNAYYPTSTDRRLRGATRLLLRAAGSWRYHLRWYAAPFELRALQRLFAYQRPETTGF